MSAMCFDTDSAPPIPVIAGAAVSHDELVLTAADGNEFAAFVATPDEPSAAGIVILPDVRGLYRFYEELALRFAERGHRRRRDRLLRPHRRRREARRRLRVHAARRADDRRAACRPTSRAAVEKLRELGAPSIFTVGFCFGGRNSWLAAASGHGLAGAVGFYGSPDARAGRRPERRSQRVGRDGVPDPRAPGRRRPEHHRRGQRRVRRGARRPPASSTSVVDLRRRAAQLLRPQAGGVRRRVRRRVAPHARVRRAPFVILAIDQGTTGTTCLVGRRRPARRSAAATASLPSTSRGPAGSSTTPSEIWQSVLDAAAARRRRRYRSRRRRDRRSRTSARRRCSGTARPGEPVAPAIVWQDRRTAERCRELDAELIRARTGLVPDPYFSATKLEWLLREHGPRDGLAFGTVDCVARLEADRRRRARHRRDERVADAARVARRRSTGTTSCSRCSASTARCCRGSSAPSERSARASCSARP